MEALKIQLRALKTPKPSVIWAVKTVFKSRKVSRIKSALKSWIALLPGLIAAECEVAPASPWYVLC